MLDCDGTLDRRMLRSWPGSAFPLAIPPAFPKRAGLAPRLGFLLPRRRGYPKEAAIQTARFTSSRFLTAIRNNVQGPGALLRWHGRDLFGYPRNARDRRIEDLVVFRVQDRKTQCHHTYSTKAIVPYPTGPIQDRAIPRIGDALDGASARQRCGSTEANRHFVTRINFIKAP